MEKPLRKLSEIEAEYQQLCVKAGHLQYTIAVISDDLKTLNETLKDLNLEAAEAKKAEDAAKDAEVKNEG